MGQNTTGEVTQEQIDNFNNLSPEQQAALAKIDPLAARDAGYPYWQNSLTADQLRTLQQTGYPDISGNPVKKAGDDTVYVSGPNGGALVPGAEGSPEFLDPWYNTNTGSSIESGTWDPSLLNPSGGINNTPDRINGVLDAFEGYTNPYDPRILGYVNPNDPPPVDWEALKELTDAGLSPEDIRDLYDQYPNGAPGTGGGGTTGGGTTGGGQDGILPGVSPGLTGYESSSNKDFYQRQMQGMRTAQSGQKINAYAAAMRRAEEANQPESAPFDGDPWSWTTLPQVQMGGSVEATPIEWGYNPNYGITSGMTNQQATAAMSPLLNTDEQAILNKLWQDNPSAASNTSWTSSGSPQAANLAISQNSTERSPELTDAVSKVINNLYTQTGGGTGGITIPDGYANPVNLQGA